VGSTIDGIVVEIKRAANPGVGYNDVNDNKVQIVKSDGSIGTTNNAKPEQWNVLPLAYYSYGSSSDLWGETWTAEEINDEDFGVVLSVKALVSDGDAYVDHIQITVYYTENIGPFPTFHK
jgi:hypothetical protein